jgi:hypothetical protein
MYNASYFRKLALVMGAGAAAGLLIPFTPIPASAALIGIFCGGFAWGIADTTAN